MEFLVIDQTESSTEGQMLYLPKSRIFKVLKADAPWGDEACLVKVFHQEDGGGDAAITIVRGAATKDLARQLGLLEDPAKG